MKTIILDKWSWWTRTSGGVLCVKWRAPNCLFPFSRPNYRYTSTVFVDKHAISTYSNLIPIVFLDSPVVTARNQLRPHTVTSCDTRNQLRHTNRKQELFLSPSNKSLHPRPTTSHHNNEDVPPPDQCPRRPHPPSVPPVLFPAGGVGPTSEPLSTFPRLSSGGGRRLHFPRPTIVGGEMARRSERSRSGLWTTASCSCTPKIRPQSRRTVKTEK